MINFINFEQIMYIDKFIHPTLQNDLNLFRKSRFLIMYVIIGGILASIMGIYNIIFKGINLNTIVLLCSLLFSVIVVYLVQKKANINLPSFLLCFFIWLASVSSAWKNGGIYSMDLQPLLNVPVVAYIFKGKKQALFWLLFVVLTGIVYYLLSVFNIRDFESDVENLTANGYYLKRLMFVINTVSWLVFYEYSITKLSNDLMTKNNADKIRNQISRDFHDQIGNSLAAISLNVNVLLENPILDENTKNNLAKIKSNTQIVYQNSKDFIWAIDSKSDYLNELYAYLKDLGEEFFLYSTINFNAFATVNPIPNIKLPFLFGKNIVLIFKEAITNITKHAKCTEVKFILSIKNNQLNITIEDNGLGFNELTHKKSFGLNNMKTRAEKIGANFIIDSKPNQGAKILLQYNLNKINENN